MTSEDIAFAIYATVGFVGALGFVALYALHPMTRKTWWRSNVGRNLMAYSFVMLLIYIQGMINRWLPNWPFSVTMRLMLGLLAILVVWWRLLILVGAIKKAKKEKAK